MMHLNSYRIIILTVLLNAYTRKHERETDQFAVETPGEHRICQRIEEAVTQQPGESYAASVLRDTALFASAGTRTYPAYLLNLTGTRRTAIRCAESFFGVL